MTQIKNADNVRLFSLNSNPKLAEQIAQRGLRHSVSF